MNKMNSTNILIAEDDFLVSEEISRTAKKIGYNIVGVAANGEIAIKKVKELLPDVVLMDIKMPKMNGIEAAKTIQDQCPTPIVMLTAHESMDMVNDAKDAGVGAYLTKPPRADEIERAVTIAIARQSDLIRTRKLLKQLQASEENLRSVNAQKDRLFSIIAHDLKNPFNSLIGFSSFLLAEYDDISEEEKKQYIEYIEKSSKESFQLLENLLNWANTQTGLTKVNKSIFNIRETVERSISIHEGMALNKNIQIETIKDDIEIYADKYMIETVIRNLISNAIKFTPEFGHVKISYKQAGDMCEISVEDSGIGMTEETINSLFMIGIKNSLRGTKDEKGSGIGLYLCQEFVDLNDGKISIDSEFGKGTTFNIAIPLPPQY